MATQNRQYVWYNGLGTEVRLLQKGGRSFGCERNRTLCLPHVKREHNHMSYTCIFFFFFFSFSFFVTTQPRCSNCYIIRTVRFRLTYAHLSQDLCLMRDLNGQMSTPSEQYVWYNGLDIDVGSLQNQLKSNPSWTSKIDTLKRPHNQLISKALGLFLFFIILLN